MLYFRSGDTADLGQGESDRNNPFASKSALDDTEDSFYRDFSVSSMAPYKGRYLSGTLNIRPLLLGA